MPERIVLTDPEGVTTAITKSSASIKDDTMDIALSWEQKFLQLDIASAMNGKWTVTTSEPVTISKMPYAGIKQEIQPENTAAAATDAGAPEDIDSGSGTGSSTKESGGAWSTVRSFIPIVILVAAALFIFKKFGIIGGGSKKLESTKKETDESGMPDIKAMTDDEIVAQMRREYQESVEREKEMENKEEDMEPLDGEDGKDTEAVNEDMDDEPLEEYTEGNTGLLNHGNSPFANSTGPANKDRYDEADDGGDGTEPQPEKGGFGDFSDY